MALIDRVRECTTNDAARRVPLQVDGETWGHVDPALVPHLAGVAPFALVAGALVLDPALGDPASRTAAVDAALRPLLEAGLLGRVRGERYPVKRRWHDAACFAVERGAVGALGTPSFGVHLNGVVETTAGPTLWVARRCAAKPTFPGRLDHLVAGGQPEGLGLAENLVKEAGEEAGVPPAWAARAVPVNALRYRLSDEYGFHDDTIHVFDLELPAHFEPRPLDGEVETFERWTPARLVACLEQTRAFKTNVALVVIDWLLRRGLLASHREHAAVAAAVASLRVAT